MTQKPGGVQVSKQHSLDHLCQLKYAFPGILKPPKCRKRRGLRPFETQVKGGHPFKNPLFPRFSGEGATKNSGLSRALLTLFMRSTVGRVEYVVKRQQ